MKTINELIIEIRNLVIWFKDNNEESKIMNYYHDIADNIIFDDPLGLEKVFNDLNIIRAEIIIDQDYELIKKELKNCEITETVIDQNYYEKTCETNLNFDRMMWVNSDDLFDMVLEYCCEPKTDNKISYENKDNNLIIKIKYSYSDDALKEMAYATECEHRIDYGGY